MGVGVSPRIPICVTLFLMGEGVPCFTRIPWEEQILHLILAQKSGEAMRIFFFEEIAHSN